MEHLWNEAEWVVGVEGIGVFGKKVTSPTATLFTTNPTCSGLVSNYKFGGERRTNEPWQGPRGSSWFSLRFLGKFWPLPRVGHDRCPLNVA